MAAVAGDAVKLRTALPLCYIDVNYFPCLSGTSVFCSYQVIPPWVAAPLQRTQKISEIQNHLGFRSHLHLHSWELKEKVGLCVPSLYCAAPLHLHSWIILELSNRWLRLLLHLQSLNVWIRSVIDPQLRAVSRGRCGRKIARLRRLWPLSLRASCDANPQNCAIAISMRLARRKPLLQL